MYVVRAVVPLENVSSFVSTVIAPMVEQTVEERLTMLSDNTETTISFLTQSSGTLFIVRTLAYCYS